MRYEGGDLAAAAGILPGPGLTASRVPIQTHLFATWHDLAHCDGLPSEQNLLPKLPAGFSPRTESSTTRKQAATGFTRLTATADL